jgi:glycosyltransferase involved in cell wall biosynthesis
MPSSSISVVICTRNRVQSLKRCIEALVRVDTSHSWEVVIVDNGSSDGTSEYLESLKASSLDSPPIVTTFEPKTGLGAARNKGWRTATGNIIAFTDDDCYVTEEYVNSILEVFEEDGGIGFLTGRILLFDQTDCRLTINESSERLAYPTFTFVPPGTVHGANMAFRRSVLEGIGGFDERLGAGTPFPCEDIDAVAAAVWAGVPGVYDPRPVVYHHHGRKTEREAKQLMRGYAAGRGAYYVKYFLKKRSRSQYGNAWIKSASSEFLWTIRKGGIPRMGRFVREFFVGMRFVVTELLAEAFLRKDELKGGRRRPI